MTKVMGIVNVTPDSFSDGGQFFRPEEAIRRAKNLIEDGADIIDLGGESTRPEATPIGWEEEWNRIEPVLVGLRRTFAPPDTPTSKRSNAPTPRRPSAQTLLSVDTYHPETAERAIAAGANIINCVSAESVPAMLKLVDDNPSVELVVPYRLGESNNPNNRTIEQSPNFSRLYLDPMIGFDTTREEDLALLRSIPELAKRGRVLVGASRKRIVKKLTGEKMLGKNLGGNLGIAAWCAMNGASVVRVHDVKETVQALLVLDVLSLSAGVCPVQ